MTPQVAYMETLGLEAGEDLLEDIKTAVK